LKVLKTLEGSRKVQIKDAGICRRAGRRITGAALAVALGLPALATGVINARCSTTDDGVYPCHFRNTDNRGSFEITADGKPTYTLTIDAPGVAFGFIDLGEGNVALPGRYLRSVADRACWRNDMTDTEVCAW
jgi:hypothetical protein